MESCFTAGNSKRHLAVLSRLPVVPHHSYHPALLSTTLLEATLEIAPGQPLHVYGVHLLAQPFVLLEMWRCLEIKAVLQRTKAHGVEPCLLAGDFNAIGPDDPVNIGGWPRRLKRMLVWSGGRAPRWTISEVKAAGFTDCFRSLHPRDDGFTLPTPAPNSRLDYILVNEVLRSQLLECQVVRAPTTVEQASDHYSIVAGFLVKKTL